MKQETFDVIFWEVKAVQSDGNQLTLQLPAMTVRHAMFEFGRWADRTIGWKAKEVGSSDYMAGDLQIVSIKKMDKPPSSIVEPGIVKIGRN